MLGKLMKYEWKDAGRMLLWVLGGIVLITVLGIFGFSVPLGIMVHGDDAQMEQWPAVFWSMSMISSMVLYIIMLMTISYGVLIYYGIRFYKKMYTDEGYLTLTLPVGQHQILISKIVVSGITYLLISLGIIVSIVALIFTTLQLGLGTDIMAETMDEMGQGFYELVRGNGLQVIHTAVSGTLLLVGSPFLNITILFGCLTIGQLAPKHRGKIGVAVYMGVLVVISFIAQMLGGIFGAFSQITGNVSQFYATTYDISLGLNLVVAGVLYFIMYRIVSRKLNLH